MPIYSKGTRIALKPEWGGEHGEILAIHCRRGRVEYDVRLDSGRVKKVAEGNVWGYE